MTLSMRKLLGAFFLWTGALIGLLVGLGLLLGLKINGIPWIMAVGLVKLTLITSGAIAFTAAAGLTSTEPI